MTTTTPDEREGLPSASGADRVYNCPGSVVAEAMCPSVEGGEVATQGSAIHLALETCSKEGLKLDEVTIVDRLEQIRQAALIQWHEDFELNVQQTQVGREERYWVYDGNGNKIESAKLDIFYINGNRALVVDYKTGFLDAAPAMRNGQLKIQALAIRDNFKEVTSVRVAIAQCRFKAHFDACDYNLNDLINAKNELLLALWKSHQPDAPRYAGTWCRYCKASLSGACREAAAFAMIPAVALLPTPMTIMSKADVLARVSGMDIHQLAFIESRGSLTRNILDAAKDRLKTYSNEELSKVGLTLGEPGKLRKVTDFQTCFDLLFNNQLTDLAEFKQWVSVGLGDMESAIIKRLAKNRGITQKAAKEQLSALLEPAITFTPSEPRLRQL